jgi:hypothetical protein
MTEYHQHGFCTSTNELWFAFHLNIFNQVRFGNICIAKVYQMYYVNKLHYCIYYNDWINFSYTV